MTEVFSEICRLADKKKFFYEKTATKLNMFCKGTQHEKLPPAERGTDGRILPALGTN